MLKKICLIGLFAAVASMAAAQTSSNANGNVAVTVQPYASLTFAGSFTLNVTDPTIASQNTTTANVTAVSNKAYTVSGVSPFSITGGLTGTPSFTVNLSGAAGSSTGTMRVAVSGISTSVAPNTSGGYTGSFTLTITQN